MNEDAADFLGYVETWDTVRQRMDAADRALAAELGIPFTEGTPVELVRLASRDDFVETEIAGEWFAAYAAYIDWCDSENGS